MAAMDRLLGVDAGGSATKVVLLEDGQPTELPAGPAMNALLTDGIAGRLEKIIRSAAPTAAGIGMPGLRSPQDARSLGESLRRRAGCPVVVMGDGDIARAGAFRGDPGIVVIAGTGSAAVGWDGERRAQAGGHGFLLGDEGSAYWIGRAAVRAALRWQDGMGGSEPLFRLVTTGITLDELRTKIITHPSERSYVAVFAPAVSALAATDPVAHRIVSRAAEHLADLAEAVQRRLGTLPVAGTGGVFESDVIWDTFVARTGAIRPLASPAVGAALLAGRCA
jgi:glucosamine kinase